MNRIHLLVGVALVTLLLTACPAADPPSDPLTFTVDPGLVPVVESVPGLEPGDPPRPTGAFADPQGRRADFVLDELMVTAAAASDLDPLLARWGGTVVDELPAPSQGVSTFLVRIDPARADPAALAADLRALDPDRAGEQRLSSDAALGLVAVAAAEAARHGAHLSLNWLPRFDTIATGDTEEAANGPNGYVDDAFQWPYMDTGSAQDIGVGAAWQLLEAEGLLGATVPIMVVDGGFNPNDDFPAARTIYDADWGDTNPWSCAGGASCPWHGTDVTVALMGAVDNGYGAAGPAGPVAELIALQVGGGVWETFARMREVAEIEAPRVINLSFSATNAPKLVPFGPGYQPELQPEVVHLFELDAMGIVLVASAGNSGNDVDADGVASLPCEASVVICVGGMAWDATDRAVITNSFASNYGTVANGESVELYAPFQVWSVADPSDPDVDGARSVTGTSFSAPFTAGVAALVLAADPSLTPSEVRAILGDTAHVGGLGSEVTGYQRRVDALGAVQRALGVPEIAILEPTDGASRDVGDEIAFEAEARDVDGSPLPVTWDLAGDEVTTQPGTDGRATLFWDALPAGEHVVTATATGASGRRAEAQIALTVEAPPLEVFIVTPRTNYLLHADQDLTLAGQSLSGCCQLADEHVQWRVRRGGSTVFVASGHLAAVPAAAVTPGSYEITFQGTNGHAIASRDIDVVVQEKPDTFPTAAIAAPENEAYFGYSGTPPQIGFVGSGSDPEDGALAGSRLRWTATHSGGTIVLCEGSAFGGPDASCGAFSAQLDGIGGTTYAIRLAAMDSDGNVSYDEVGITVLHFVP